MAPWQLLLWKDSPPADILLKRNLQGKSRGGCLLHDQGNSRMLWEAAVARELEDTHVPPPQMGCERQQHMLLARRVVPLVLCLKWKFQFKQYRNSSYIRNYCSQIQSGLKPRTTGSKLTTLMHLCLMRFLYLPKIIYFHVLNVKLGTLVPMYCVTFLSELYKKYRYAHIGMCVTFHVNWSSWKYLQ